MAAQASIIGRRTPRGGGEHSLEEEPGFCVGGVVGVISYFDGEGKLLGALKPG